MNNTKNAASLTQAHYEGIATICQNTNSDQEHLKHPDHCSLNAPANSYFKLFDEIFPTLKIDILSKDLMFYEQDQKRWVSIFNSENIEYLKTFAAERDLDRGLVKSYLYRYKKERRQKTGADLLLDIPEWNGDDLIAKFASYIHSPLFNHQQIGEILKEWFSRSFQRVYNTKVDNFCLVFLGKQGIGKEVFIRALTSGFGQFVIPFQYQGQQKDILHALHSGVVVHIEEFDHIAGKLPEAFLKMLITTSHTLFRSAYGFTQQLREARWNLIASCNRDDFLRDHTGNRRFVIIPIDKIDNVLSDDRQPMRYPDGLIDYPAEEGLNLLAQAKVLAELKYAASRETKAIADLYIQKLTPVNPEEEFLKDLLEYMQPRIHSLELVKGCYFLSTTDHQEKILELARRYQIRESWSGIKNILARKGIDPNARTRTERGLGVPPEIIKPPLTVFSDTLCTLLPYVNGSKSTDGMNVPALAVSGSQLKDVTPSTGVINDRYDGLNQREDKSQ